MSERTILVTRARDRARAWIVALAARGLKVEAREIFVLEPMFDENGARSALESIETYAWILLTSANGLRFLRDALDARGLAVADLNASFGVVGPQTRAALEASGVEPRVVAERADSEGLAAALAGHVKAGERVLVVRPEVSRPELAERLAAAGAAVDSVPFYRNRPAEGVRAVAEEMSRGLFDAAVFSSPSAFDHVIDAGADAPAATALIAIGETTAAAIRARGCEVAAVARQPTPEGIADAVEEALLP